jgi:hypothetical protein
VSGLFKLFFNLAILALGFLTSRRHRSLADAITCGLGFICLAIAIVIALSGILHEPPFMKSLHRWGGHGLVIALWCSWMFALGVSAEQTKSRGVGILLARLLVITLALLLGLFASFTGYLGPAHDPELGRDSHNRFIVLHMFIVPTLLAILLGLWCKLFWPKATTPPWRDSTKRLN